MPVSPDYNNLRFLSQERGSGPERVCPVTPCAWRKAEVEKVCSIIGHLGRLTQVCSTHWDRGRWFQGTGGSWEQVQVCE